MNKRICLNCGKEHKRDSAFCCPYCKGGYLAKQGQPKPIVISQFEAMAMFPVMAAKIRRRSKRS